MVPVFFFGRQPRDSTTRYRLSAGVHTCLVTITSRTPHLRREHAFRMVAPRGRGTRPVGLLFARATD